MCKKSESISKLAMALVKAQSEITPVGKDAENSHFKNKYATLDNIIDETRPILAKHGLAIIQMPGGDGEHVKMVTMIMHESGEWMETEPLIMRPAKNDPQGMGSCITYARRYSYSALLSISTDEDDDGNASSNPKPAQGSYNRSNYAPSVNTNQRPETPQQPSAQPSNEPEKMVSEAQVKFIHTLITRKKIDDEAYRELLVAMYNVASCSELTGKQAKEFINYLQK